jgi:hypothetical protein
MAYHGYPAMHQLQQMHYQNAMWSHLMMRGGAAAAATAWHMTVPSSKPVPPSSKPVPPSSKPAAPPRKRQQRRKNTPQMMLGLISRETSIPPAAAASSAASGATNPLGLVSTPELAAAQTQPTSAADAQVDEDEDLPQLVPPTEQEMLPMPLLRPILNPPSISERDDEESKIEMPAVISQPSAGSRSRIQSIAALQPLITASAASAESGRGLRKRKERSIEEMDEQLACDEHIAELLGELSSPSSSSDNEEEDAARSFNQSASPKRQKKMQPALHIPADHAATALLSASLPRRVGWEWYTKQLSFVIAEEDNGRESMRYIDVSKRPGSIQGLEKLYPLLREQLHLERCMLTTHRRGETTQAYKTFMVSMRALIALAYGDYSGFSEELIAELRSFSKFINLGKLESILAARAPASEDAAKQSSAIAR